MVRNALPARLWSHQEAAEFLGLTPATLHQINYRGTGPRSYKVGRLRKYDPADIAAWLNQRASQPSAA
ncbi:helix-turn-helix transcriptional regulator [Kitasatospora cineracea]|uniref:Helix-turn-helix protein n=1 Tax=Kitasatospora cineracea TaxID=88074 RepID=A0A3N4RUR4_9ACTN|nr:helix-turn-helix domain-containing protein [Kitasatospora cineracea]RPE34781.1 helix-turn-helix protein [Kitasatospora cineracea]